MAWDEGIAHLLRDDLQDRRVTEKKMFGGLAFLIGGHMVCGVYKGGAMFRVGRAAAAEALKVPGTVQMTMGSKLMVGMIGCSDETCADDGLRGQLMALALATVAALPPKT